MKTVCFFGIFDPNYSRSRVLKRGFEQNGWKVDECRIDPRVHKGIKKYYLLWKLGQEKKKNNYDVVIVAYPGQTVAWLGRVIFGPQIIFDAFLSLYDSNVFDRKIYGPRSLGGMRDYFFDWLSAKVSKYTLLDTSAHIKYYSTTFKIPKNKFIRVLIGADDSLFIPRPEPKNEKFVVEFHGMFIPLQGVEYIIGAAALLKDDPQIHFVIVGEGQTFKTSKARIENEKLTNITLTGKVPQEKVSEYISGANICLGIFGNTEKTVRVIPNKVYECAAMGKAIITADSAGMREVFTDGKDVIFSKVSDEKSLAEKILLLKNNEVIRHQIGKEARVTYERDCTPAVLVIRLVTNLDIHEKN